MARRIPNRGPITERDRRRLEPLAKQHGVAVERLVDVIRARRRFRNARSVDPGSKKCPLIWFL
jgi:hypothetical protein